MKSETPGRPLRVQVAFVAFARLVINTSHRMLYPFLPEFSRGLGVPVDVLVLVLSGRSALTVGAPLVGSLSDRLGRRIVMYASMGLFTAAMGLVVLHPSLLPFVIATLLATIAKFLFDPTIYAYMGDRTPYAQRGLIIAILELSWSAAFLIGMPLVGWLMARRAVDAWQAPFSVLALLGLLAGAGLWFVLPHDAPNPGRARTTLPGRWMTILRNPRALAGLVVGLLISAANENLNVVLGIWMETAFGLSLTALGFSTAVIGVAELIGEGGVMALVDRLGKRRAIAGGLGLSALAYLTLPLLSTSLTGGLLGLFITFVAFEFTLVATLPLMTELVPTARASLMSVNTAGHAVGRMGGALLGNALFQVGFFWNGAFGAVVNLIAVAVLLLWVHEAHGATEASVANAGKTIG